MVVCVSTPSHPSLFVYVKNFSNKITAIHQNIEGFLYKSNDIPQILDYQIR